MKLIFIFQPVLLAPHVPRQLSLRDVLLQMRLHNMASLIDQAQLQPFLQEAGKAASFSEIS